MEIIIPYNYNDCGPSILNLSMIHWRVKMCNIISETIKLNVSKSSCKSHPYYTNTNQVIMLGYIGYKEEYNYNHHVLLRFAK